MTAKIGLEDVRFHAPHGFYEEEHLMGNEFSIDVEVEASITGAAQDDDLGGTVNYATIYYLLQAEMKKPTQLLEALAYRMANRILNQFDSVSSVKLRLRKINPPLGGKVGAAVVEVNLGTSSGGDVGGRAFSRQDTFEDPAPRFSDEDYGGGMPMGGGGMGGGFTGLRKKTPSPEPPQIFDDFDDDDFDDDDDFLEGEEMDFDELEEGDFEDLDYEESDEDFEEADLEILKDFDLGNIDFDKMNFDDLDLPDFDPDDLK